MCDVFKILTLQDYGKVATLFNEIFPEKYKEEFDMCWMYRMTSMSLGVWDTTGTMLKGFVVCRQIEDGHLRIEFLGVNPLYQKDGIGTLLLKHVLQSCGDKELSLIPVDNLRIINWYQKHGFSFTGKIQINTFTGEEEKLMLRSRPLPTI